MENTHQNLIIFDDDQQVSNVSQMKKYTQKSKNQKHLQINTSNYSNTYNGQTNQNKDQKFYKQIESLKNKINNLQRQGDRIRQQIQKKIDHSTINTGIDTSINNKNHKQIQQVLIVVQKKVQLVIQQSKKIITKISQNFDKKIAQLKLTRNNQNIDSSDKYKNRIIDIESAFLQKTSSFEKYYNEQLSVFIKQSQKKEEKMIQQLNSIDQKYIHKLKVYQTKQKQHVDWIHHLQAKLKQRKNKKMITITQEKPQLTALPSRQQNVLSQYNMQNVPNRIQYSKVNCSIDQNNSRAVRKHKIFEKSVSPAPKTAQFSPTNDSGPIRTVKAQPSNQNTHQISQKELNYKQSKGVIQQGKGQNLGFFNDLKNANEKQFYQNVPKPNNAWDKFVDLNQYSQQYTQGESDDFFTPIEPYNNSNQPYNSNQQYKPRERYNNSNQNVLTNIGLDKHNYNNLNNENALQNNRTNNNEKVYSPFDLN